ncbi:carbohydrate ABC transporter permease [Mycoplasma sp. ES3157-GEN-MYC]|uniref:Carbohydrate ABC transporter permease n=2 Tax=Mycoplasma miroungigenitalium TaxID=754515 RepID=A0A6M4JBE1_9MOLU|nr:carbohydrate ABC transporter permease [Mycoplasma miroungigenitalium]MBU4690483.1 carbohydrate ABC transporter permease [Mycoplasma miroungigenitalium]MBU4691750.1 carbohydrate ABC transporter permease [Mycoplasma miroungigenitalium]QJR43578.1 carbohydrate ABC transporter permease [Mycoplasma miroungigenitalium]
MFKKITNEIIKYIVIGFLCVLILFPLYYLLLLSLKSNSGVIADNNSLLISEFTWSNFGLVLKNNFVWAFLYTLLFSFILIIVRIFTYSFAIAGLLKMNKVFQKTFLYFFIMMSLIPEFTIYLSLTKLLIKWDLKHTFFAVITNAIFSFFTFTYIFNIAKDVKNIKHKLMINDNLKWHQKVLYVYFPKLRLAYVLLIVFTFISAWNDYLWPVFLLRGTNVTNITIWYLNVGHQGTFNFPNLQAAGAFLSIIIPVAIYGIFAKKINSFN